MLTRVGTTLLCAAAALVVAGLVHDHIVAYAAELIGQAAESPSQIPAPNLTGLLAGFCGVLAAVAAGAVWWGSRQRRGAWCHDHEPIHFPSGAASPAADRAMLVKQAGDAKSTAGLERDEMVDEELEPELFEQPPFGCPR